LALALWYIISTPECPLVTPDTFIVTSVPVTSVFTAGYLDIITAPPAQLDKKIPSSSESILSIILPLISEQSIASAPSIPTSSSTVNIASISGCLIESSSRIASAYATAIPSSPPRLVLSAFI